MLTDVKRLDHVCSVAERQSRSVKTVSVPPWRATETL